MSTIRTSLLTIMLLAYANCVEAGKSVPVIPNGASEVTLLVNGKNQTYYRLTTTQPLIVEIDGPGKLSFLSRIPVQSAASPSEAYVIRVMEQMSERKVQKTRSDPSDVREKESGRLFSKMRKATLKVPEGSHTYTFLLEGTSRKEAALRFRFTGAKGRRLRMTMEPLSYDRVVTAMVKEKLISYYVSTAGREVQLRVIGPTTLTVNSRLNYDAKMKGEQRYSITVREKGSVVVMKPLATTKALGVIYQEWKDVVPSKVNTFSLDIPAGEHTYVFELGKTLARSVSFKFSIPKSDLKNEE